MWQLERLLVVAAVALTQCLTSSAMITRMTKGIADTGSVGAAVVAILGIKVR